jgi:hypothetical protein
MNELLGDIFVELHVPDFVIAKEFYISIGYSVVWEKKQADNGYLVLKRNKSILNFYGGTEKVYEHDYFGRFPKDTSRG